MSTKISTVIFDFGGVLGLPLDPVRRQAMASLCGLSLEQFAAAYPRDRRELDRGTLPAEAYWQGILAASGRESTPELIARLEEEDSHGWTRVNHAMVRWAAELRSGGYLTAILSNMPVDKLRFIKRSPDLGFVRDFPVTLFSCDYLLAKPEPEIYRKCLELLGRPASECLFLDDTPANVEAGRAAGIHSLLFTGVSGVLPELSKTWNLPVRSLLNGSPG